MAAGPQPRILRSTDGGKSWRLVLVESSSLTPPSVIPTGNLAFSDIPDSNAIYLCYDGTTPFRIRRYYADFYRNWLSQETIDFPTPLTTWILKDPYGTDTIIEPTPLQIRMYNAEIGCGMPALAGGFNTGNRICYTSDGWRSERRVFLLQIHGSHMSHPPVVLMPGVVGCIFSQRDSGTVYFGELDVETGAWTLHRMPFTLNECVPIDMCFVGDNGWLIGARTIRGLQSQHIIYTTNDRGATWHKQLDTFRASPMLRVVRFRDRWNGIVGSNGGEVYYTTGGGQTWVYEQLPNELRPIVTACLTDNAIIVGTSGGARIYRRAFSLSSTEIYCPLHATSV